MICTVSTPEMSAKNQPQLVYMRSALRCISRNERTSICSLSVSARFAWRATHSARECEGLSTTSMYSLRAAHGSTKRSAVPRSKREAAWSRRKSRAWRKGERHAWFHPSWALVLHPQSRYQRPTPCAQLHEVPSPPPFLISTSIVGGRDSRKAP